MGAGSDGGGGDDDAVAQGVGFLERAHDLRDGRLLLPDGVVDADDAGVLLVQDGVEGDGGLAGLAVADDELALAAADRHHAVDGLEAGLHRLAHRLAVDDAGRQALDRREGLGEDRALAVDGLAERVHDAAEHLFADRHRDDAPGALDRVAFLDGAVFAEQHGAHAVFFEVQRDAEDAVRELEHLAGHGPLAAVHARDAVAEGDDGAHFRDVDIDGKSANLLADDLGDFVGSDVHALIPIGSRVPVSGLGSGLAEPLCLNSVHSLASSHELLAQLLELRLHGAVVDGAADLASTPPIRLGSTVASTADLHAGDLAELGFDGAQPSRATAARPIGFRR